MLTNTFVRLGIGTIILGGLMVLGACGQETETAANEDPYSGFDTVEPVPNAPESVADEETSDEGTEMASLTEPPVDSSTAPVQNPDADDVGEDLFRRGFQQDAMALWEANAEAGDSYAAYRLGVEYFDAQYVERNIELALRYQTLAAELGNAAAMFELGTFLETGIGVRQDMDQAAGWYLASALRGYAPAQHNVATMYEDGVGQPRDLVQAYLFYSLAKANGFTMDFEPVHDRENSTFVPSIARLQNLMSEEQLVEAQSLIDNFEPMN